MYSIKDIAREAVELYNIVPFDHEREEGEFESYCAQIRRIIKKMEMEPAERSKKPFKYSAKQMEEILWSTNSTNYFTRIAKRNYLGKWERQQSDVEYKLKLQAKIDAKRKEKEKARKYLLEIASKVGIDENEYHIISDSPDKYLSIWDLKALNKRGLITYDSLTEEENNFLEYYRAAEVADDEVASRIAPGPINLDKKEIEVMVYALFDSKYILNEKLLLQDIENYHRGVPAIAIEHKYETQTIKSIERLKDPKNYYSFKKGFRDSLKKDTEESINPSSSGSSDTEMFFEIKGNPESILINGIEVDNLDNLVITDDVVIEINMTTTSDPGTVTLMPEAGYSIQDILAEIIEIYQLAPLESDYRNYTRQLQRIINALGIPPIDIRGKAFYYSRKQVDYILYSDDKVHKHFVKEVLPSVDIDSLNCLTYQDIWKGIYEEIIEPSLYHDPEVGNWHDLDKETQEKTLQENEKRDFFNQVIEDDFRTKKLKIMIAALFDSNYMLDKHLLHYDLKDWYYCKSKLPPSILGGDSFCRFIHGNVDEFFSHICKERLKNWKNYFHKKK